MASDSIGTKKKLETVLSQMESQIVLIRRQLEHDIPVVSGVAAQLAKQSVDAVTAAHHYEMARFPAWNKEGT